MVERGAQREPADGGQQTPDSAAGQGESRTRAAGGDLFGRIFESAPIGMAILAADGHLVQANDAFCAALGFTEHDLLDRAVTTLLHADDTNADAGLAGQLHAGEIDSYRARKRLLTSNGEPLETDLIRAVVRDEAGRPLYELWQIEATRERRRAEGALRLMSLVDDLTGLYNRQGFLTLAQQYVKIAHRAGSEFALVLLHLDDLEGIRTQHGAIEADRALAELANVLRDTFRDSDIIARISDDEFVVIAVEARREAAPALSKRIQDNLALRNARLNRPYVLAARIGVARYDPEAPRSIGELLHRADAALRTGGS